MAKIDVYTVEMSGLAERMNKISSVIEDAENTVAKVQRNLDFEIAAKQSIADGLTTTKGALQKQKSKTKSLSKLTSEAVEEYSTADAEMDKSVRNILGKIVSQIVSVARNANNFFVGTNIKQHQMINSLFMREKAICITAVGMAKHLKKVWEELTEIRDTGDSGRNAKNAGIKSYYAQGRTWDNPYYNDSYWTGKKEYDGWDGCGICVSAMLLSYFDVDVTPAQILDGQGGNKDWGGRYIQKKCAEKEVTKTKRTNGSMTQAEKMEILDRCLDEFKRNPKHNAPPVVSMDKKSDGTPHYVIVVGRVVGKDGKTEKYIIVDSDDNGCTILNPYPEREKSVYGYYDSTDENNRHYNSPIKNVFQWTKR